MLLPIKPSKNPSTILALMTAVQGVLDLVALKAHLGNHEEQQLFRRQLQNLTFGFCPTARRHAVDREIDAFDSQCSQVDKDQYSRVGKTGNHNYTASRRGFPFRPLMIRNHFCRKSFLTAHDINVWRFLYQEGILCKVRMAPKCVRRSRSHVSPP